MFSLSYTTEYKGPPLFIELEERPFSVFGVVTDIHGKRWHPYDTLDAYWGSTMNADYLASGFHQQDWLPHELIVTGKL